MERDTDKDGHSNLSFLLNFTSTVHSLGSSYCRYCSSVNMPFLIPQARQGGLQTQTTVMGSLHHKDGATYLRLY